MFGYLGEQFNFMHTMLTYDCCYIAQFRCASSAKFIYQSCTVLVHPEIISNMHSHRINTKKNRFCMTRCLLTTPTCVDADKKGTHQQCQMSLPPHINLVCIVLVISIAPKFLSGGCTLFWHRFLQHHSNYRA